MARGELDERFSRSKLRRYLLADENVIVAQRQHWAALWKPILIGAGSLLVVLILNVFLPPSLLTDLLWWALLGVGIWAALKWYEWFRNWLVATDKRVMVNHGLVKQGVAMFSLSRVPDLTYTRTTPGQLLGYGELQRESAGAGQTLHRVTFVEHPHATYTTICAAIFELQDRMFGMDDEDGQDRRFEEGPPQAAPGGYPPHVVRPEEPAGTPAAAGGGDRQETEAAEEAAAAEEEERPWLQYISPSRRAGREPSRQGSGQSGADYRDTATEPPPYRRPATDDGAFWDPTTNDPDHNPDF